MALPLDDVLGAELMTPARKAEVIAAIRALPISTADKRYLLGRWGRIVGAQLTAEDYAAAAGAGAGLPRSFPR